MYVFRATQVLAQRGAAHIEAWLRAKPETLELKNVETEPSYQAIDVDFLWYTRRKPKGYKLELKVDSYYHTGNFFFETYSNLERATPGCFLYTEADLLFYYFLPQGVLYILPLPETRAWFLSEQTSFPERDNRTPVKDGFYTTRGRLVPRSALMRAIPQASVYTLLGCKSLDRKLLD
jgi:hypothetical protein